MSVWLLFVWLLIILNTAYWVWMMVSICAVPNSSSCEHNEDSITLIVVFKDSYDLVSQHLTHWLNQSATMDLLLVHDGEAGSEFDELGRMISEYPNVRLIAHSKKNIGKKEALEKALSQTSSRWVILTDDDGIPSSSEWVSKSVAHARLTDVEIVLLYGPYLKEKGWLQRSVRFENVLTAWQYFSWWNAGKPYMGIGRNILYGQGVYLQFKNSNPEIASGDDDLFFQSVGTIQNTQALLDPDTFVYSAPPKSLNAWLRQKGRHLTTASSYPWTVKYPLGAFSVSQILVFFAFTWMLWNYSPVIGLLFVIRWLLFFAFGKKALKALHEESLYFYLPFLDVLHGLYLFIMALIMPLRSTKTW